MSISQPGPAALVAASPYPILGLSLEGAIRSWNPAAERLLGYRPGEVAGRPLASLLDGGCPPVPELLRRAVAEGGLELDCRVRTRSGEPRPLVVSLAPVSDDPRGVTGFVATFRPRDPGGSDEHYRLIVESAADFAIFTMDAEGRVSSWNTGARRLLGYAPEEILGQHARVIFVPEDREAGVPERELAAARKEGVNENERWHIRQDGERLWGSGLVMPLRDGSGYVKILQDHTHRRIAEERLAKTLEQLLASNEALKRFAYVASHDLQEPIRTMGSFAQLVRQRYHGRLDASADEFLDFIVAGAKRLEERVRGLLDRAKAQTVGGGNARTDMEQVLRTVLLDLGAHVRATGARITHDPLPIVRGDPLLQSQVLQNLLSNALKFAGDKAPRAHVWAADEGSHWRISVRDEGTGMDPADAERLFGVFERGVEASAGGTGVGLAICKRIVETHGGRIWVESRPGDGATFHFTVPKP